MLNKRAQKIISSLSDKDLAETLKGFRHWNKTGELNCIADEVSQKIKKFSVLYANSFIYEQIIEESISRWLKIVGKEI
jgi:hypothetical protein